jgi:hypothetical protein
MGSAPEAGGTVMQERQVFSLIVRTAGLVVVLYSTFALFFITAKLLGIRTTASQPSILGDVLFFVVFFAIGVVIMRSAKWIVILAFGRTEKTSN